MEPPPVMVPGGNITMGTYVPIGEGKWNLKNV